MKVLFLVEYSFKTGENEYIDHVLVSINAEKSDSFEKQQNVAIDSVMKWFPTFYPESKIIYVLPPKPTVKDHRTNSYSKENVIGEVVNRMTDIPPVEKGEQTSLTVLIDLDGRKRNFTLGSYDVLNKHWITQSGDEPDMKHGVWTEIDFLRGSTTR